MSSPPPPSSPSFQTPAPTPSTLQTVTTAVDSGATGAESFASESSSTETIALDSAVLGEEDVAQITPAPAVGVDGGGLTRLPFDLERITFESVVTVNLGRRGVRSAAI